MTASKVPNVNAVARSLPMAGIHFLAPQDQIRWLIEPSDLGCTRSQHKLGRLLMDGDRSLENLFQAYKWLFLSVVLGNESAKKDLVEVNTLMSNDEINDAWDLAVGWIEEKWEATVDRDESKWSAELLRYRFCQSSVN